MISALILVAVRCRRTGLEAMLGRLRREQRSLRNNNILLSSTQAADLVAAFCRLRIWFYTAHRRCLFDSFVLAAFLIRQRVSCSFVIGVSTKPFRAHAWVQIGQFVLNDTAEHVQTFAPILIVDECG
jgi:Transglutaminase-like superfamily